MILGVIYPKAFNRLSGFWSPESTCPWLLKTAAQRPCGRFRGGSGATCIPRHGGAFFLSGHQACQRAGFALSPVLVTSSGSEQPPPTKSKAPTAWCPRPQREDISQAPSRISRDLGRLVIDTGLWQSGWERPCPGSRVRLPRSQHNHPCLTGEETTRQTDQEQGLNSDLENGRSFPPSPPKPRLTEPEQASEEAGVSEGGGRVPSSSCPGGGHGRPPLAFAFTGTERSPRQNLFFTPGLAPSERSHPQLPASS